jgi:uncharacterized membrane protein YvbJ
METCVGCGSPVESTWKFCIHCGLAIDRPEGPSGVAGGAAAGASRPTISTRTLVLGGIAIFVVGLALLAVAIAFFAGAFR